MTPRGLPPEFQRVCRHASGSLWLSSDHLLAVISSGFSERYVQVALRDIGGVFVVRTPRRLLLALVPLLVAMAGGITALGVLFRREPGVPRASLIFFGVAVIVLVVNALRGPGCCAHLVTDVQTLRLPGFRRLRPGRRILARLESEIRRAQGGAPAS